MSVIWTLKQISEALGVNLSLKELLKENLGIIQFNSNDVNKGDIFIALNSKSRDGHDFVADALDKGAALAITSKDIKNIPKNRIIKVENTFQALQKLAVYKRRHLKACVIGVTGSVGKTTTKNMLGLVLQSFGKTFVSRKNFNNYLGVPVNLASISDDDEFVVIEMGMNAPGEIKDLAERVMPDIAIITSVAEAHLEFFESTEQIADAKSEIFTVLDSSSGTAILNRDISTYDRCKKNIDDAGISKVKTFGESSFANIYLVSYERVDAKMVRLEYNFFDKKLYFTIQFVPKHIAINFAAVLAVIHTLKLDVNRAIGSFSKFQSDIGRGLVVKVERDGKKYSIITDYYNANPKSMKAGLEHLSQYNNPQKVAILGDMKELGENELKFHSSIIPYIIKSGVKKLFLVGDIMPKIKNELPKSIFTCTYDNSDNLKDVINQHIEDGEVILIKGSNIMKLWKVAAELGVKNAL